MYVGSFRFDFKLLGNVAVVSIRTACSFVSFAVAFSFSQSFFRPDTGVDVGSSSFGKEICCGHQELGTATALDEKNFVVFRNFHQFTEQVLSFFVKSIVFRTAMTHFDNAHASSSIIKKFCLRFLQNLQGHCGRTGVKIICTFHLKSIPSIKFKRLSFWDEPLSRGTTQISRSLLNYKTGKKISPHPPMGRELSRVATQIALRPSFVRCIGRTRQIHHLPLRSGTVKPYYCLASTDSFLEVWQAASPS